MHQQLCAKRCTSVVLGGSVYTSFACVLSDQSVIELSSTLKSQTNCAIMQSETTIILSAKPHSAAFVVIPIYLTSSSHKGHFARPLPAIVVEYG